jgi:UDP-N-acetylmuramate dehydrogenase
LSDWRSVVVAGLRGECTLDAPLATRTAIRVGGSADLLVRPADPDDLSALLSLCLAQDLPVFVLGNGANLLVADAGIRGVVVRLPADFGADSAGGTRLILSAGAPNSRLVARAQASGLVGCEFLSGIPGTLGGAVVMNAGTKLGEMKNLVSRVEVTTAAGAGWLSASELAFAYRHCELPPGAVVTRVEVALRQGDVEASAKSMLADREYRRRTQPLSQPTFGSTFRNPPGRHAGQLIEAAGLKGFRIGGAAWSELHANFVVNLGGASASEVRQLMKLAQDRVREEFGIALEPEVRLAGEFREDSNEGQGAARG